MSCVAGAKSLTVLRILLKSCSTFSNGACRVPEALQPFMPGHMSFIPFRKRFDPKSKKYVRIADRAEA